jgi:large subunit ribosomal protein L13
MKTTHLSGKKITRNWHLIDLKGQTLGRVSTKIASLLFGKDKPDQSPHLDCGDYVVAINASKIKVTGKKLDDKKYYSHSGYAGGLKETSLKVLLSKKPRSVIEKAVKGMLPKNKTQQTRLRRLKVYSDDNHPHMSHFEKKAD